MVRCRGVADVSILLVFRYVDAVGVHFHRGRQHLRLVAVDVVVGDFKVC